MPTNVNQTGSVAAGVQVASSTGAITGLAPASLQVVGYNGSTTGLVSLTAGSNITLTQAGSQYNIASQTAAFALSASDPLAVIIQTLPSNVSITTAYNNYTPTLAQMQTAFTSTAYQNISVNSVLKITLFCVISAPVSSVVGAQLCLYSATDTTNPLVAVQEEGELLQNGGTTNSKAIQLTWYYPCAAAGQSNVFYLGVARSQKNSTTNTSLLSRNFIFQIEDCVPYSIPIVNLTSTNQLGNQSSFTTISALYSSMNQAYNTTTALQSYNFLKRLSSTNLIITAMAQLQATVAANDYFAALYVYNGTTFLASTQTSTTSMLGSAGTFKTAMLKAVVPNVPEGILTLNFGGTIQQNQCLAGQGSHFAVCVEEDGGNGSSGYIIEDPFVNANTVTPATVVATLTPQYSQTALIGQCTVIPPSSAGIITLSGVARISSTGANTTSYCVVVSIYTSNSPTATPVWSQDYGNGISTQYNGQDVPFAYILNSWGAGVSKTFYVCCSGAATGSTGLGVQVTSTWRQTAILNTSSSTVVESISSSSTHLLTFSPTSGTVVGSLNVASVTSTGVLAVSLVPSNNTTFIMPNSGAFPIASPARGYNFSGVLAMQFGGSVGVGQTYNSRYGLVLYEDTGTVILPALSGNVVNLFKCEEIIGVSTSNIGSATGAMTLVSIPVTSVIGMAGTPYYSEAQNIQGMVIANNAIFKSQIINNATYIAGVIYNLNTSAFTAATNANFTAGAATNSWRSLTVPLLTVTAPP